MIKKILFALAVIFSFSFLGLAETNDWWNIHPTSEYLDPETKMMFALMEYDEESRDFFAMVVSGDKRCGAPAQTESGYTKGTYIGDIAVPSEIIIREKNIPVLGVYEFYNEEEVTSIKLPDNLKFIIDFHNNPLIKELIIPENTETLKAIYSLENLEKLILPNNKGDFAKGLYYVTKFNKLQSVNIPYENDALYYSFFDCPQLKYIEFANTKIVTIADSSFCNLPSLEEIELPYNTNRILRTSFCNNPNLKKVKMSFMPFTVLSDSFNDCPALEEIWIRSEAAYPIGENCFDKTDKEKCVVYVPQGTLKAYREREGWKDFKNMVEYDLSGVSLSYAEPSEIKITGGKGCVNITADGIANAELYSLDGRHLRSLKVAGSQSVDLPRGIYLVVCQGERRKVSVE